MHNKIHHIKNVQIAIPEVDVLSCPANRGLTGVEEPKSSSPCNDDIWTKLEAEKGNMTGNTAWTQLEDDPQEDAGDQPDVSQEELEDIYNKVYSDQALILTSMRIDQAYKSRKSSGQKLTIKFKFPQPRDTLIKRRSLMTNWV